MIKCFRVFVDNSKREPLAPPEPYDSYLVLASNAKQAVQMVNSTLRQHVDDVDRGPMVCGWAVHFELGQVAKHGKEKFTLTEKHHMHNNQGHDIREWINGVYQPSEKVLRRMEKIMAERAKGEEA